MMRRRTSKALKPAVTDLEVRCVQTVISPLAFGGAGLAGYAKSAAATAFVLSRAAAPGQATAGGPTVGNPSPSAMLDPTTLTQRGLARATFITKGTGPYAVSSPTYVGHDREVTYIGPIVSSQFMQGTMVMRIETQTVADPTTVTGFVALRDRNAVQSGNILVLDLYLVAMDQNGRPSRLNWRIDANDSAGAYAGAVGQGTLSISYQPHGHSRLAAGGAVSLFQGLVLGNGVNDLTQFNQNYFK